MSTVDRSSMHMMSPMNRIDSSPVPAKGDLPPTKELSASEIIELQNKLGNPGKLSTSEMMELQYKLGNLGKLSTRELMELQYKLGSLGKLSTSELMELQYKLGSPGKLSAGELIELQYKLGISGALSSGTAGVRPPAGRMPDTLDPAIAMQMQDRAKLQEVKEQFTSVMNQFKALRHV